MLKGIWTIPRTTPIQQDQHQDDLRSFEKLKCFLVLLQLTCAEQKWIIIDYVLCNQVKQGDMRQSS